MGWVGAPGLPHGRGVKVELSVIIPTTFSKNLKPVRWSTHEHTQNGAFPHDRPAIDKRANFH
jgi:hypothetical protein